MISLHNLMVVARYEMKTLFRSWFFRIFAGMGLFILFWMDFGILTVGDVPWAIKALPATVPYMNLLFLNMVQAVIAVFLASDFLKRDKKLDTTEVIYMRNMSNGDYVVGKTLGILLVFLALNVAQLAIALIFNIIAHNEVPVALITYAYYLLLISLPTLVFILGLSFFMMVLIGNQAVTFVVLLGYIALTLFYLGKKLHFLFDYMGFYSPLLYSDMAGFGDFSRLLVHRGIYLLAGIAGIGFTVKRLKRLPQSRGTAVGAVFVASLCLAASLYLGYGYVQRIGLDKARVNAYLNAAAAAAGPGEVELAAMAIDLKHQGRSMAVSADMTVKNSTAETLDTLVFRLNPGLVISRCEVRGQAAEVHRDSHIWYLLYPLAAGESLQIHVDYHGNIDERIAHMDAADAIRNRDYRVWVYRMAKRHAFLTPDYALLTPEVLWYPQPGAGYSEARPWPLKRDFTDFDVKITPRRGLMAVAQGALLDSGATVVYEPETPLTGLTVAIGKYVRRSITVDSVDYELITHKSHNYWEKYLDQLPDTLTSVVRDLRQDYENQMELPYSFKRLRIVEVPIHFVSFPHLWESHQATVQPEMVLFPENAMGIEQADFKQMKRRMNRHQRRTNEVTTPQEEQTGMFQRFVNTTLFTSEVMGRPDDEEEATIAQSYTLTPNLYSYVTALNAPDWPLLDGALEAYIGGRVERSTGGFRRMFMGLTDEEKVNQALIDKSLLEYLADPDDVDLAPQAVRNKGKMLFSLLEARLSENEFDALMQRLCRSTPFGTVDAVQAASDLETRTGVNLPEILDDWHHGRELPSFRFTGFNGYLVRDDGHERTQIRFTVQNLGAVDGIVKVSIRMGGPGMGGRRGGFGSLPGADTDSWLYSVPAGAIKEVGLLLDSQPRRIEIEMQVAENLPNTISRMFEEYELNKRAVPFEGERVLNAFPELEPNAIVVDNEDAGFTTTREDRRSPLKRWLGIKSKTHDAYEGINFWRAPTYWQPITLAEFYGEQIKSAVYTRSGDGSKKAVWKAPLPAAGNYGVWVYYASVQPPWRRRNDSQNGEYHYYVHHEDGVDEVMLDIKNAEEGWNYLGNYYLASDTAMVELTNECKARMVVADAVKWVRR